MQTCRASRRAVDPVGSLLAVPRASLYLAVVFALPLVLLLGAASSVPDGPDARRAMRSLLGDPYHLAVIWNTLRARRC